MQRPDCPSARYFTPQMKSMVFSLQAGWGGRDGGTHHARCLSASANAVITAVALPFCYCYTGSGGLRLTGQVLRSRTSVLPQKRTGGSQVYSMTGFLFIRIFSKPVS